MNTPGAPSSRPPGVFTSAFLALSLMSLVTYFGVQLLTASFPLYAAQLGADDAAIGLLVGVIATVSLVLRPFAGWWLDRGLVIPALVAGILTYIISAVGYWIAASVAVLLAARAFTGAGVALFVTGGQTLTVSLAPAERRGEALSLYAITHPLAQILAPPIGVAVAQAFGYRWLFAACIAIHLIGLALMWPLRGVRAPARPHTRLRLIHPAVLLPGVWMLALMVTYGAALGLLAVHAARRGLGNPGVVFTAMAVGLLAVLLTVGRVSDRAGRRAMIVPGMALAACGMGLAAVLHGWALTLAGAVMGIGLGLAQPSLFAAGVDLVADEERGRAIATMGLFLEVGIGLGAIGGGVLARSVGTDVMFGVAGMFPALGAVMVWLIPARGSAAQG
ncbi:MAG: MFS transporter [Armatimonadota bacterium]|nr:MFS transporter [Armatimonadota bacterium]